ncbi:BrnA antitoxin family protein, partial [candidate division NPL-UPA2 bacterium]|nr:BrnA antitoxin family protein [candidate division NPL-UPA2 bacterium]
MKQKKSIPKFKTEAEERAFWAKYDSTDFVDYNKGKRVLFPNLKPSVKTISIRLLKSLLESLKVLAHKNDIPYQSLVKMILSERVKRYY